MPARIGIIGDVHAEHRNLAAALEHLHQQHVDAIICTGDVADGTGDLAACARLLAESQVLTVRGNHDRWLLQGKARHVPNAHQADEVDDATLDYLAGLPSQLSLHTSAGNLLLCHGVAGNDLQKVWPGTARMPAERSRQLDEVISNGAHRLMVNGHVHYRTLIHFEQMTLLNAGTLRGDHHPGFAMLDLRENIVRGFEFHPEPREVKVQHLTPAGRTRTFIDTQCFDGDWEPVTLYA